MTSISKAASLGWLCAAVAVSAGAQTLGPKTAATAAADQIAGGKAGKTTTLTGCVGQSPMADGTYTLADSSAAPAGQGGAATAAGAPATAGGAIKSATGTALPGVPGAGAMGAAGAVAGAATGGATGAVGTVGQAAAAQTGASPRAYRLTGLDMAPYAGKRVEIVGVPVRSAKSAVPHGKIPGAGAVGTAGSVAGAAAGSPAPLPEFRVRSVQLIGDSCQ